MKITKQRFNELGLGVDKESCLSCFDCTKKNGVLFCGEMNIQEAEQNLEYAPCLDEERIREEMTDEEYDAYRHGRLVVEEGE